MDRLLIDKEIEDWLLDRLGEGNKFRIFNREFCEDLGKLASAKAARCIIERIDGSMIPDAPSNLLTGEWYLKISTDKWQALKKEFLEAR